MEERRRLVTTSYVFNCSVFFFLLLGSSSAEQADKGVNYEVLALMGIKSSLIDPHGVMMTWDELSLDPCSWNMVSCPPNGLVIGLGAPSQNLSGTLAPSIGNLTNLQTLLLQNNYISGHIPSEIGKLVNLKTLDLSQNNFSGQIPDSLFCSRSLQYLRLNNNTLTGTIPPSLANTTQLTFLDLSYNNLSGAVPRVLAKTFNVMGNPQICSAGTEKDCDGTQPTPLDFSSSNPKSVTSSGITKSRKLAVAFSLSLICVCLVILVFGF